MSTEQIIMNGDDEEFRTFVDLHAGALRSSGVPQNYWGSLYHKITNEVRLLSTNIHTHVEWEKEMFSTHGTGLLRRIRRQSLIKLFI